ncbi:uncharacterized protein [Hoplias malabaricus]|uniref:uncharacterized protein n=1 Tax=Hoplias malabaricus TaxID=27720 RepID=UPI003461DB95
MCNIVDLSKDHMLIAEKARSAASDIVKDAINKGCYGFPVSFYYTCSEPVDPYTFCCIPTKDILQDLQAKIDQIHFKEDNHPNKKDVFAYVKQGDGTNIVYLCNMFWSAPDTLCTDSQPGTIIHEVSHLLGTEDITYENITMVIDVEGMGDRSCLLGKSKNVEGFAKEEMAQVNANSLEYEFETIINHDREYSDGRYQCCGEIRKNTVCESRSTIHYRLHEEFGFQKDDMENRIKEMKARAKGKRGKIIYVKKMGKACERIPVSGP